MTLYTSDINYFKSQSKRYIIFTSIILIIGIIYELFSHNIFSIYMAFAFTIPLIMGVVVPFIIYKVKLKILPSEISKATYNCAIMTLTIGSLINGVLEIYGTTNSLIYIYLYAGLILLIICDCLYIIKIIKE